MSQNDDRLRVLTSVPYEWQSGIILSALESAGIRATSSGALTAGFRAEAPGWVRILVFEEDLPRAREALQAIREDGESLDWSDVDVGRPGGS